MFWPGENINLFGKFSNEWDIDNNENQKDDINFGIDIVTRNILKRLFDNGDVAQNDVVFLMPCVTFS